MMMQTVMKTMIIMMIMIMTVKVVVLVPADDELGTCGTTLALYAGM